MNNFINGQASTLNADLTNDELDDAQLEAIYGGMSCSTANAVAQIYYLTGDVLSAFGDDYGSGKMYGRAFGVLEGACDK